MPTDYLIVQSSINNHIDVGFIGLHPNYLKIASGITIMLAPKLYNDLANLDVPVVHGIMNALE